jgi:hypothetical protein
MKWSVCKQLVLFGLIVFVLLEPATSEAGT